MARNTRLWYTIYQVYGIIHKCLSLGDDKEKSLSSLERHNYSHVWFCYLQFLTTFIHTKKKEMDYSSISKPKLWGNIVCSIICYALFAYELSSSIIHHSSLITPLLFFLLGINSTFRIFCWIKLSKKKGMLDENAYLREENRNGIIIRIFNEVTALILFLVLSISGLVGSWDTLVTILMVISAICFGAVLVSDILNLKRFDRL